MKKNNNAINRHTSKQKLDSMLRIIEATQLTKSEKRRKWYIKLNKALVIRVCYDVYGFSLLDEKRWFRKLMYDMYGDAYALRDFADFHGLALTKCKITDTNWKNYLTENGKVK
jgi:curved DNA-binding protein CbpA